MDVCNNNQFKKSSTQVIRYLNKLLKELFPANKIETEL